MIGLARAVLAVVGSANLDIVIAVGRRPRAGETVFGDSCASVPGGKGANQAIAAARVASAHLIGHVGDDEAGRTITRNLAQRGVGLSRLHVAAAPTGRAFIFVTPDGENSITVLPGANAELDATSVSEGLKDLRPSVVLAQCEVPLLAVIAAYEWCRQSGARFVLNPSPVPALPPEVVAGADTLIVNGGEARALAGFPAALNPGDELVRDAESLVHELLADTRRVVLTAGADGAYVGERGAVAHIPGLRVHATDTTGAGDEFAGVLAGRLACGDSLAMAASAANQAAARTAALARTAR
jgi:ribokinase